MAKKKNKQKFAHSAAKRGGAKSPARPTPIETTAPESKSADVVTQSASPSRQPVVAPKAQVSGLSASGAARWRYVGVDLRRISILLLFCIALELGLAYLLDFTSVGSDIFNAIKI